MKLLINYYRLHSRLRIYSIGGWLNLSFSITRLIKIKTLLLRVPITHKIIKFQFLFFKLGD